MFTKVFSDLSERLYYNSPKLPLLAVRSGPHVYGEYSFPCHWHLDLEFMVVLKGSLSYFINGKTLQINAGEGLFVNSKRLHYGYADSALERSLLVVVIHPSLLGYETVAGKEYLDSKFNIENEDYIYLTDKYDWQKEVLLHLNQICDEMYSTSRSPLRLISLAALLCACICENIQQSVGQIVNEHSWLAIWNMTEFINKNYDNKITLDDIAASGSVCRSKCCQLFSEYLHKTPNSYLTHYRISKSCEMLRETNMPVIEVSMDCGFKSPSYFTHIFLKETGVTPKEYRNKYKVKA